MSAECSTVIWEGEDGSTKVKFQLDTFKSNKLIVSTLWRWDQAEDGVWSTRLGDPDYQFRIRSTPCARAFQKLIHQEHQLAMPAAKATLALQLKRMAEAVS